MTQANRLNLLYMNKSELCMGKGLFSRLILVLAVFSALPVMGQDNFLFREGFETSGTSIPAGWTLVHVQGSMDWKVGLGAGEFTAGQVGIPDTAAVGTYNAYFRVPSTNAHVTRLISPLIDLGDVDYVSLSFWHAQYPRNGQHSSLKVYYSTDLTSGDPILLASYPQAVYQWTLRELHLPSDVGQLYLIFEGHSGGGIPGSVCIDEVTISETVSEPRQLASVSSAQPSTSFIVKGTDKHPVLKTTLHVTGNTGPSELTSYTVHSLNTDDNDLAAQGVKLWFTTIENFSDQVLLGSGDFSGGIVTFAIDHTLPTGFSHLWVTYDISDQATHGNYADALLAAQGITFNDETFPEVAQDPEGKREIRSSVFYDNFDSNPGWTLNGEWQIAAPLGLGGQTEQPRTEGFPDPSAAYSGTKVLGTDLTGLGSYAGNYEPNLGPHLWQAIMPLQDFSNYADLTLTFQRWLNVHSFHRATIDYSINGGITWTNIWRNNLANNANTWSQVSYPLPQEVSRRKDVLIRFTLGETGTTNLQSGWNIDDLSITGTYIVRDTGISQWLSPASSCALGSQEEIRVRIKNFGAHQSPSEIPLAYSLDGGQTWQREVYHGVLAPGETADFSFSKKADFSLPGSYQVLVKTELADDQDPYNDQLLATVTSLPVLLPPYSEDFEQNEGFWAAQGNNSSWQRALPTAQIISQAASGSFAWITNPSGFYNAAEFSWVEGPCLDFGDIENPVVDFHLRTHLPAGLDGLGLDYSLDGGQNWQRVEARNLELARHWYNHMGIQSLASATGSGSGWTGNSNGWINPRVVLPAETAYQPSVKLRLVFASNPMVVQYEGAAFDKFSVYSAPDDIGVIAFTGDKEACEFSEQHKISIIIRNFGINTMKTGRVIPVGIDDQKNGKTYQEQFTLQAPLMPGQTVEYTFSRTFNMKAAGTYTFTAYTLLEEKPDLWGLPSNNSTTATYTVFGYPEVSLGEDIYDLSPQGIILDPGSHFAAYLWQDNSTASTFTISSPHTATYQVRVTDENHCSSTASVKVHTYDAGISQITQPTDNGTFSSSQTVSVSLFNHGVDAFEAGWQIQLQLKVNQAVVATEVLSLQQLWQPNTALAYSFNKKTNMLASGPYNIEVSILTKDANPANNKLSALVVVPELTDLAITSLISPDKLCSGQATELPVTVRLTNSGNMTLAAGETFTLSYQYLDRPAVEADFVLSASLAPAASANFSFPLKESFSSLTSFPFLVSLTYDADQLNTNNQIQKAVSILPLPVPSLGGDIFTSDPTSVVLFAGDGFTSYLWQNGNTTPNFHVQEYGTYTVTVTDQNGCRGSASVKVSPSTALKDPSGQGPRVMVYPNPARHQVIIRMEGLQAGEQTLELRNQTGSLILSRKVLGQQMAEETIDLQQLTPGLYYIRLLQGNRTSVYKLIISGN